MASPFQRKRLNRLPCRCIHGDWCYDIPNQIKAALKEKIDKQIAKGMNPRAMRVLIVGIRM